MDSFEKGEIVIGRNFVRSPERNGMEAEITGSLQNRTNRNIHTGEITKAMRYELKWADGRVLAQEPYFLKKKKPPEEASWEEIQNSIGWNPTKQGVEV